jgi:hypothetical protein
MKSGEIQIEATGSSLTTAGMTFFQAVTPAGRKPGPSGVNLTIVQLAIFIMPLFFAISTPMVLFALGPREATYSERVGEDHLWMRGMILLDKKDYGAAKIYFDRIVLRYPHGVRAESAKAKSEFCRKQLNKGTHVTQQ